MFSASTGPRLALAPELAPNVTIKPYVTGAISSLGGIDYLNAGGAGAGASLRAPIGDRVSLEPGFEWRRLYVNASAFPDPAAQTTSWLASGDVYTYSLSGNVRVAEGIKLEGRAAYAHATARLESQRTDQFEVQAMARFEFAPPFEQIPKQWTIAPYGRFLNINFVAPNFIIDPLVKRRDTAWVYGLAFDAPVTADFGFEAHAEFLNYMSNLSSFSMTNASITFGPTAKF